MTVPKYDWATSKQRWMIAGLVMDPNRGNPHADQVRRRFAGTMNAEKSLAEGISTISKSDASDIIGLLLRNDHGGAWERLKKWYNFDTV